MKRSLTDQEKKTIDQNPDLSSRKLAEILDRGKSTINDYRARKQEEEVQEVGEDTLSEEVLDSFCKSRDYDLANLAMRLRNAQKTNNQLRRIHREGVDCTQHFNEMVQAVQEATKRISKPKVTHKRASVTGKESATMEILFSDYQIGKVGEQYNSSTALKAIQQYGEELNNLVESRWGAYNLERIIFASLGDIVEDHMKHGVQSATSTDSGLAEQMANAIEYLWNYVLKPLCSWGIPMEVICIAGNHGSSQHKGMDMYKAGLYSYDYVIYKTLEGYCKAAGFDHVVFNIPEGVFGYTQIYGHYAVYEHGYFNSSTEKSMEDQLKKRGQQIKKYVEYFRCGDMHHLCSYDNHKMVLNGAFFGTDMAGTEYSGILGFNSTPAQAVMFHIDNKVLGRNTVKEFISIQVAQ